MNALEKIIVRSAPRAWFQKYYECPLFKKIAPLPPKARVLEMGCGDGTGVTLIYTELGAAQVDAFDLDPQMVRLAQLRIEAQGWLVPLWQGSAADIPAENNSYDAVFSFGMLHHMNDWTLGIKEAYRVLKPGGYFYMGEYYKKLICNQLVQKFIEHPANNRFDHDALCRALKAHGFEPVGDRHCQNLFGWVVVRKPKNPYST